jgi:hypothetical protein
MTAPFDIFQAGEGGVLWRESASTLSGAKARIQELVGSSPVEYLIVNQKTGDRVVVRPSGAGQAVCSD